MDERLSRFVAMVKSLSVDGTEDGPASDYSAIKAWTSTIKLELGLTTKAGTLKENAKKNRYKDILPYDQSRVVLTLPTDDSDSDYINASFIQGAAETRRYIATQGPLHSTLVDFWRMTWQYEVKVIIMACREVEMGKRKCEGYWATEAETSCFGPFIVSNMEESYPTDEVVVRSLSVRYQRETRTVLQFQYISWPDHDVPYTAQGILGMMDMARNAQADSTSPILIHCSAGCGRTGVICALDYIQDLLVSRRIGDDFSIMKIVMDLRRQRPSSVQTKAQYQFIFTAVGLMFERALLAPVNHCQSAPKSQVETVKTGPVRRPEARPTSSPGPARPTSTTGPARPTSSPGPARPTSTSGPANHPGAGPTSSPGPARPTSSPGPARPTSTSGPVNHPGAGPTSTTGPARRTRPAKPTSALNPTRITNRSFSLPQVVALDHAPRQGNMNDTYAVVNKTRLPRPASTLPPSSLHHYDNDQVGGAGGAQATPLYSTVKPKSRTVDPAHSATPIYDTASPANHRLASLGDDLSGYELVAAPECNSSTEDDYEYVSSPRKEPSSTSSPSTPENMGFNCRIQKPRGPRDPPAEWARLER